MFIETLLRYLALSPDHRILDLGCGAGALVRDLRSQGYDAYGCDIAGSDASDFKEEQISASYLRAIAENPYRLPFENDRFDFVVSEQVLEHVLDYESVFNEMHRVLKEGGIGLHIFPARYVFIEPHVLVPLGTLIRHPTWLRLWATLGIRNRFQIGRSAKEVARMNRHYLITHTNYLPSREILRKASRFSTATFREDLFILATASAHTRPNLRRRLVSYPPVRAFFASWSRAFGERLLFLVK